MCLSAPRPRTWVVPHSKDSVLLGPLENQPGTFSPKPFHQFPHGWLFLWYYHFANIHVSHGLLLRKLRPRGGSANAKRQ